MIWRRKDAFKNFGCEIPTLDEIREVIRPISIEEILKGELVFYGYGSSEIDNTIPDFSHMYAKWDEEDAVKESQKELWNWHKQYKRAICLTARFKKISFQEAENLIRQVMK